MAVLGLTLPSLFGGMRKTPSVLTVVEAAEDPAVPVVTEELGVKEDTLQIDPTNDPRLFFL